MLKHDMDGTKLLLLCLLLLMLIFGRFFPFSNGWENNLFVAYLVQYLCVSSFNTYAKGGFRGKDGR